MLRRTLTALVVVFASAAPAAAQVIYGPLRPMANTLVHTDSGGNLGVTGDMVCTAGCAGGTTDTDDGSVAGGQSTGIAINLSHLWNGATWVRMPGDATNGLKVQLPEVTGTEFDTTSHTKSLQIGGSASGTGGEWHAAYVTSTTPGVSAQGLVVRDPSALSVNGSGLNTTGYGINAYSRSDSVVHSVESRDSIPLGTEYGLLTRPIFDTQVSQLHNTIANPTRSLQIGGAATNGGAHRHVGASNADPGVNDVGLFVRDISGMGTPGSAAPGIMPVISGRDPVTNAVRQVDILASAPTGTENGVITRPILAATAATSTLQAAGNLSLSSIKTNTDPLVTAGAGGYVRQDSTATMAKETGGNLAAVAATIVTPGSARPTTAVLVQSIVPGPPLPLFPCNAVRRTNCQPKGY